VNQGVDFIGGRAWPDVGFHQVQGLKDQPAGPPDAFDLLRRLDADTIFLGVLPIR
jgi:hypothetical protein